MTRDAIPITVAAFLFLLWLVVALADLAQIRADSRTHQDIDARERIAKAVERISSIFEGKMTSELQAKINKAVDLM